MRNAKIVCTLGPASNTADSIRALANAGMSVARINASHGTREDRAELIDLTRRVGEQMNTPLAVMMDLKGPEIRTGANENPVQIETGSTVRLEPGDTVTSAQIGLSTSIARADPGDRILIDDGRIEMTVSDVGDSVVTATVDEGGELSSHKGVNVPGLSLDTDFVTEKDRTDLDLVAEKDVDFVAASFVRGAADIVAVNEYLESVGADVPVVAKIERAGAVENSTEIIETAHGVMVARGDLGVELPMENVPLIQKRIIRQAQETGTPVITATEMLDSMVTTNRPTRAEASDVANAVLDGTDAVMLSAETAVGDHPVKVVEAMDRIIRQVEESTDPSDSTGQRVPPAESGSRTEAVARSGRYLARDVNASAIIVVSESGYTARRVAKFRPGVPVVATTPRPDVIRQMSLVWGVGAQQIDLSQGNGGSVIAQSVQASIDAGVVESGDTVIVLAGMMTEIEGEDTTNTLKVHLAAETLAVGRTVVDGRVSGPIARISDGNLSDVLEGSVAVLPTNFEGEFSGDPSVLAGIVSAKPGMTGYAAMIARELGIPMVSGAILEAADNGDVVTIDGERGAIYRGEVLTD